MTAAVEAHGIDRVLMLSLTIDHRHRLGDDLRLTRKGVANAWRRVQMGAPWVRRKTDIGLVGEIRALEVTHGFVNGFHPHLHVLLFVGRDLSDDEVKEFRAWLSSRWQSAVERELGGQFVPDDEHGCDLRRTRKASYLTKLGLEMTAFARKRAKKGNRTPWQIAADFAATGDVDDLEVWREYSKGIYGAKRLTWSRGLRAHLRLGEEKADGEIVEGDAADVPVCTISGAIWDVICDVRGAKLGLLEAAEQGGDLAVRRLAGELLALVQARGDPQRRAA